jgi:hypothetical protein
MPESRINASQLRGQRWRETVHELLRGVDEPVDPLVERAGDELARRYQEAGDFDDLSRARVAEVVNLLNERDLALIERWLLGRPYVLVRALEWAQRREPPDDEALAARAVEYVGSEAVPLLARLLAREATRPDALYPEVQELHLRPGEVDEQDLVDRLRERGLEIRAGLAVGALAGAMTEARRGEGTTTERLEEQFSAGRWGGAEPLFGDLGDGLAALDATGESRLHDLFCDVDLPNCPIQETAPQAGLQLLAVARTLSCLYISSERQPAWAAMDALHDQAMSTGLLVPRGITDVRGGSEVRGGSVEQAICDLRILVNGWGHRLFPVTVEQRAAAVAAIGIRDRATCVPVNTRFSEAMEQVVRPLATLATSRDDGALRWVRPAVQVASLRAAGALEGAVTGETLSTLGLWKRQSEYANRVLSRGSGLHALLGVVDADPGPAPAIRRILPGVPFDPPALREEWRALDTVFSLVTAILESGDDTDASFDGAASAAVRLLVLRGRFRARAIGVGSPERAGEQVESWI